MTPRLPFRNLEPSFCSGLFDDPLLLVRQRPLGRNLLFDCGQLVHLAKRALTAIEAVFVSHAHMDHWMGIDTLTRHVYVAPKTVELFGPPGLAGKLEHKLAGYDWNLSEEEWGSYRVHEIHPDHVATHLLAGPRGFRRTLVEEHPRGDRVIFANQLVSVAAELCDHRVPSLAFRIEERPAFVLDEAFFARHGLRKGPWLKQLKRRFYRQEQLDAPLPALAGSAEAPREILLTDVRRLCAEIAAGQQPPAIGYLSDVGYTPGNVARIRALFGGLTLLICECTFLGADIGKARSSHHLATPDLNRLLELLRPAYVLPMHLSKSYGGDSERLYRELVAPPGTEVLRIPDLVTPAPRLQTELAWTSHRQGADGRGKG